jgi:2-polyprenyl-3-methyl-5-hydroxy-6-metoxy-1,4-benzoquinol methylase
MAKSGEIDYLKNIARAYGEHGVLHAVGKPFSDPNCQSYLAEIAALLALLPAPPARLLDLGCGTGWTSSFFAKRGYEVTGADIAPDMIHHAVERRDREELNHLHFLVADYEDLDGEGQYDAVVFFDSLHHAIDEKAALSCAYRALKAGGVCVTSEPGGRHCYAAQSREAVEKFNVTEKSMPPLHIIRLARMVGFRDFRVYPHAFRVHREIFSRSALTVPIENAPHPGGGVVRALRLAARLALGPWRLLCRSARLTAWNELACWRNGITVLVK